jgi:ornithine--oxo-acid transaminase
MNDQGANRPNGNAAKGYSTDEVIKYAQKHCIAGLPPHPVVASKASGSYIWDLEGRKYIDLISAYSSSNQGHSHPRIVAAMMDQCQKTMLPGYCVYNDQYPLLCKKICEVRSARCKSKIGSRAEVCYRSFWDSKWQ